MKLVFSIILSFYFLVMGSVLLVSSVLYYWDLHNIERARGIYCPRIYYINEYSSTSVGHYKSEYWETRRTLGKSPLCRNMRWWKLFTESGFLCGSSLILYLSSKLVALCYGYFDRKDTGKTLNSTESQTKVKIKKDDSRPRWLSHWITVVTAVVCLSSVFLSLTFIFLGHKQFESVPDGKGITDGSLPPLVLYICSICQLVILLGSLVIVAIRILFPSFSLRCTRTERTSVPVPNEEGL